MDVVLNGEDWNYDHACGDLAKSYQRIICAITDVATRFCSKDFSKILVVVRCCPCCLNTRLDRFKDSEFILVSPFYGINPGEYNIATPSFFPPYRNPGLEDECASADAFLMVWRETIAAALALPVSEWKRDPRTKGQHFLH